MAARREIEYTDNPKLLGLQLEEDLTDIARFAASLGRYPSPTSEGFLAALDALEHQLLNARARVSMARATAEDHKRDSTNPVEFEVSAEVIDRSTPDGTTEP